MIIKVCGMRDPENIRAVEAEVRPDWMGFIFWPRSARYVADVPRYLPERCVRVGVFVDAELNAVLDRVCDYDLRVVQLHGRETHDYVHQLRRRLADEVAILKAINVATADDLDQTRAYCGCVDAFLFDTKAQLVGGNGTQFDWRVLDAYDGATPFLLSGGIGPDDAERIRALSHPRCIGVDLNSRFETAAALKDVAALTRFADALRSDNP